MRERPLSLTIVALLTAAVFSINIALSISSHTEYVASTTWMSTDLGQAFYIITWAFGLLSAVMLLRAKKWARWSLVIAFSLDLVGSLIHETTGTLILDALVMAIVLWYIFRPSNNAFFYSSDDVPPLTHQLGPAACYIGAAFFLMMSLLSVVGWELSGIFATYAGVLFGLMAAATLWVGNVLGLILDPKRDVGSILVAASALSLFVLAFLVLEEAEAAQMLYVWISMIASASVFATGVGLVRRARMEDQFSPSNTAD